MALYSGAVRDELDEWLGRLEAEMNESPVRAHTTHMYALKKTADALMHAVTPLRSALDST